MTGDRATPGTAPPLTPEQVVLAAVERRAPGWYGAGARLRADPISQRRPWSVHVLPVVDSGDRSIDLIVKIPLWDEAPDLAAALEAGPQAGTKAEYEILCRIEAMVAASGDPGLAAVRGIDYLEEVNAVVTERLESGTLRSISHARQVTVGRAIGAWIRRFHDEIGAAEDVAAGRNDIEAALGFEGLNGPLPGALSSAVAGIRRDATRLLGRPLRRATTHGDLGPSNVLVTPDDRVAIIDPNLEPGPVEADLAKLSAALRTGRLRLLTGIPHGKRLHPVEAAIIEGYGQVSEETYLLCRRAAAARRWAEIESAARGLRRIALPMARRVLRSEVR